MLSKLSVFILAVVVSTAFAANKCRVGTVVNGRANSQPYSFPVNWNETHSAPHLAAEQSCSWVVTIPSGYYAKIIMSGRINDSVGHFQTVDTNGNVIMTQRENKEPYYFPSPKFTLIVDNEAPATFGFQIVWAPFPAQIAYDAGIGSNAQILNITKDVFAAEFGASGRVSILAFPADPAHHYTLRSVMIFSGNDYTGNYLTNLAQIYNKDTQWIGPDSLIYIANVEARNVLDQIMLQNADFTRDVNPYKELVCGPSATTCSKSLTGGNGKSGVVYLGNNNQTLTSIEINTISKLDVYYGGLGNFFHYATYNGSSIQSQLPLSFLGGGVTQYIVSNGNAKLTFQFN